MPVTVEEEVVVLYALYACGGKASKARAIHFIASNYLMRELDGDEDIVATDETRVENRIAWTRQTLKDKGELDMPERGKWQLTQKGRDRIERIADRSLNWQDESGQGGDMYLRYDRISGELLKCLKTLGGELAAQKP
jgi:restriction endonuclease Mrr